MDPGEGTGQAIAADTVAAIPMGEGRGLALSSDGEIVFGGLVQKIVGGTLQNEVTFYGVRAEQPARIISRWTRLETRSGSMNVAVAGDALVWLQSERATDTYTHELWRAPRAGGTAERVWSLSAKGGSRLQTAGGDAFVSVVDNGSVTLFALRGSAVSEVGRVAGPGAQEDFAVDETSFFVGVAGTDERSYRAIELDRRAGKQTMVIEGAGRAWNLQAHGGFLYYAMAESDGARSVRRVRRDGRCAARLLALAVGSPGDLFAVNDGRLAWMSRRVTPNDMGVGRWEASFAALDLRTGMSGARFSGEARVESFAFDGRTLYLLDNLGRRVRHARLF